jgi:hypothetical protein
MTNRGSFTGMSITAHPAFYAVSTEVLFQGLSGQGVNLISVSANKINQWNCIFTC